MNNIQLETILLSIKSLEHFEYVNQTLKESGILDANEQQLLSQYETYVKELKTVPSHEILRNSNNIYNTAFIINEEDSVNQSLILYIKSKKTRKAFSKTMNNLTKLQSPDADKESLLSECIEELNNIKYQADESFELNNTFEGLYERYKKTNGNNTIKSGINEIDQITGGFLPGSVVTVGAYTGSYKTMTTVNMCYNAIKEGHNVLYISLEVTKDLISYDVISRHSCDGKFTGKLPHINIKKHKLDEEQEKLLQTVSDDILTLPGKMIVLDETDITSYTTSAFDELLMNIDTKLFEETGKGVEILVIDHVQLLKFSEGTSNPYEVTNYWMSYFRRNCIAFLGKEHRPIVVYAVSQTNRAGYEYATKHGGQYLLTALAEANEIERASSYILFLYLDEKLKGSNECLIQISKVRDGETMPEPLPIRANPEYYLIGDSSTTYVEDVAPVFDSSSVLNFNSDDVMSLDDLLNS